MNHNAVSLITYFIRRSCINARAFLSSVGDDTLYHQMLRKFGMCRIDPCSTSSHVVEIMNMSTPLGDHIRELRLEREWKPIQLSRLSNISQKTIRRIESGKTADPHDDTLGMLVNAFNEDKSAPPVALRELQDLRDRRASPISQAPIPITADETVSAAVQPSGITQPEPAVPMRTKNKVVLIAAIISVLAVALLAGGYVFIIHPLISHTTLVHITGTVICADNERVVGVYIVPANSNGSFANWYKTTGNGSEAAFKYDLPNGSEYNVHVGCGGSIKDWQNQDKTEYGSGTVKNYIPHVFLCQDMPLTLGDGPCYLQQ